QPRASQQGHHHRRSETSLSATEPDEHESGQCNEPAHEGTDQEELGELIDPEHSAPGTNRTDLAAHIVPALALLDLATRSVPALALHDATRSVPARALLGVGRDDLRLMLPDAGSGLSPARGHS